MPGRSEPLKFAHLSVQPASYVLVIGKKQFRFAPAMALALAFGLSALLSVREAEATPIHPDIRKLLKEHQDPTPEFAPARAGWHGPESAKTGDESPSPAMEKFSPASAARANRESLIAAAVPDWRVLLVILALIVVLRKLRTNERSSTKSDDARPAEQIPSAA